MSRLSAFSQTRAGSPKGRHRGLDAEEAALEVDVDGLLPAFLRGRLDAGATREAGIVDQRRDVGGRGGDITGCVRREIDRDRAIAVAVRGTHRHSESRVVAAGIGKDHRQRAGCPFGTGINEADATGDGVIPACEIRRRKGRVDGTGSRSRRGRQGLEGDGTG